jgi:predicted 2-oxoglutarate/Fe(II)-dependent dioxygenase YbiX
MIQIVNDFISEELCSDILKYLKNTDEWVENPSFENTDIINIYGNISFDKDILLDIRNSMQFEIESIHDFKLKPLSLYFIRWKKGSYLDYHSDNSSLNGEDTGFSDLKHAAMVYLNDDFDGGEIVFQRDEVSLKPIPRSFVAFDGGINNIHAVNDVRSGTRYVIGTFWDYVE